MDAGDKAAVDRRKRKGLLETAALFFCGDRLVWLSAAFSYRPPQRRSYCHTHAAFADPEVFEFPETERIKFMASIRRWRDLARALERADDP